MSLGRRLIALAITLVAAAPHALAGNISSGGGELRSNAQNPWFVKNTTHVRYCVDMDEANFGLDRSTAETSVRQALDYWHQEFAGQASRLGVGTQEFLAEDCADDTDLRFQLGKLTDAQRRFVGKPDDYVSLEVRTDYDPTTLRGKGFIYVTPERGPLRLADDTVVKDLWSRLGGRTLKFVLAHELGHVFGLPHLASGASDAFGATQLMAPDFPDEIAHSVLANAWDWRRGDVIPPGFFRFAHGIIATAKHARPSPHPAFFGFPADWCCVKVEMAARGFRVYAQKEQSGLGPDGAWRHVGDGTLRDGDSTGGTYLHPVKVLVTKDQKVFQTKVTRLLTDWGITVADEVLGGNYRSVDGSISRPVLVSLHPGRFDGGFAMAAEIDGLLYPNILFP